MTVPTATLNHRVCVEEKEYPGKSGISTLVGIYPTLPEAEYIANIVKTKNKLQGSIIIDEVDSINFPVTSNTVRDFISR